MSAAIALNVAWDALLLVGVVALALMLFGAWALVSGVLCAMHEDKRDAQAAAAGAEEANWRALSDLMAVSRFDMTGDALRMALDETDRRIARAYPQQAVAVVRMPDPLPERDPAYFAYRGMM